MTKTVLVLDENPIVHGMISSALQGGAVEVHHEFQPKRFLEKAQAMLPDIILMSSPGYDRDFSLHRSFAQQAALKSIPRVALLNPKTSLSDKLKENLQLAGVLLKPLEANQIKQEVAKPLQVVFEDPPRQDDPIRLGAVDDMLDEEVAHMLHNQDVPQEALSTPAEAGKTDDITTDTVAAETTAEENRAVEPAEVGTATSIPKQLAAADLPASSAAADLEVSAEIYAEIDQLSYPEGIPEEFMAEASDVLPKELPEEFLEALAKGFPESSPEEEQHSVFPARADVVKEEKAKAIAVESSHVASPQEEDTDALPQEIPVKQETPLEDVSTAAEASVAETTPQETATNEVEKGVDEKVQADSPAAEEVAVAANETEEATDSKEEIASDRFVDTDSPEGVFTLEDPLPDKNLNQLGVPAFKADSIKSDISPDKKVPSDQAASHISHLNEKQFGDAPVRILLSVETEEETKYLEKVAEKKLLHLKPSKPAQASIAPLSVPSTLPQVTPADVKPERPAVEFDALDKAFQQARQLGDEEETTKAFFSDTEDSAAESTTEENSADISPDIQPQADETDDAVSVSSYDKEQQIPTVASSDFIHAVEMDAGETAEDKEVVDVDRLVDESESFPPAESEQFKEAVLQPTKVDISKAEATAADEADSGAKNAISAQGNEAEKVVKIDSSQLTLGDEEKSEENFVLLGDGEEEDLLIGLPIADIKNVYSDDVPQVIEKKASADSDTLSEKTATEAAVMSQEDSSIAETETAEVVVEDEEEPLELTSSQLEIGQTATDQFMGMSEAASMVDGLEPKERKRLAEAMYGVISQSVHDSVKEQMPKILELIENNEAGER